MYKSVIVNGKLFAIQCSNGYPEPDELPEGYYFLGDNLICDTPAELTEQPTVTPVKPAQDYDDLEEALLWLAANPNTQWDTPLSIEVNVPGISTVEAHLLIRHLVSAVNSVLKTAGYTGRGTGVSSYEPNQNLCQVRWTTDDIVSAATEQDVDVSPATVNAIAKDMENDRGLHDLSYSPVWSFICERLEDE